MEKERDKHQLHTFIHFQGNGRSPIGGSQGSTQSPRLFAGQEKRHKGVRYIGTKPRWPNSEKEQKGDQSLPAKYPREVHIQRSDNAPYPGGVQ